MTFGAGYLSKGLIILDYLDYFVGLGGLFPFLLGG